MRRLHNEILTMLAVGVALALVLRGAGLDSDAGSGSEPFQTHRNLLLVEVTLRRQAPPTIDDVVVVREGRITVSALGDSHVRLEDANGKILHEQAFQAEFETTIEEIGPQEEVPMTFILPNPRDVRRVVVVTPVGEASRTVGR